MFYIVGRIADRKIVETGCKLTINEAEYLKSIAINNKGVPADFTLLPLEEESAAVLRIKSGDEWTAAWDNGAMTGVNFSVYDALDRIGFQSDTEEIVANGIDTCTIQVQCTNALKEDVDFDSANVYIKVQSPYGVPACKKISIVKGVGTFNFQTTIPGTWVFPAGNELKILGYRIENRVTINALLP